MTGAGGSTNPADAADLDGLVAALARLRVEAGSPSYAEIARRVGRMRSARGGGPAPGKVTVYDCFRPGRRRVDEDLLADVVEALDGDAGAVAGWRRAHRRIVAPARPARVVRVTTTLPRPTGDVVARPHLLAELAVLPAGSVALLCGMAGSGKTDLALRVATAWTVQPGRVLHVDLDGSSGTDAPTPADVLNACLAALGSPLDSVESASVGERRAELGRLLAPGPAVVVLDDAASVAQVAGCLPLLPNGRVIVTSRRRLRGVRAATASREVTLRALADVESRRLLAAEAGADRVRAEPEAAAAIVARCGGLPLEIAVVAATIRSRQGWSLADHAGWLARQPRDEILRPALLSSYHGLDDEARRTFRLLALHPGSVVGPAAVAALAGAPVEVGSAALAALEAEHLLTAVRGGRFQVHDVVRAFAGRMLDNDEPRHAQSAAMVRLAAHSAASAARAAGQVKEPAAVEAWMTDEWPLVLGVTGAAGEWPLAAEAGAISDALATAFDLGGHFRNGVDLHRAALAHGAPERRSVEHQRLSRCHEQLGELPEALRHAQLARSTAQDQAAAARAALSAGNVCKRLGRNADAIDAYRDAAHLARGTGEAAVEARAVGNLADTQRLSGDGAAARVNYAAALALAIEAGDDVTRAIVLMNRSVLDEVQGHLDDASAAAAEAMAIAAANGMAGFRARGLLNMANVARRRGAWDEARAHLADAAADAEGSGQAGALAEIQCGRGLLALAEGDLALAAEWFDAAAALVAPVGATGIEIDIHNGRGELQLALGAPAAAAVHHRAALELARRASDLQEEVRAQAGLANTLDRLGDADAAAEHRAAAIARAAGLGLATLGR